MSKKQTHIVRTDRVVQPAQVVGASVNAEARTFDVVFATDKPVYRYPWWVDEPFNEVLVIDKSAILSSRLDTGSMPFLKDHNSWSIDYQMGRVTSWSIAGNEARATIQFSTQERFNPIWGDIESGIISNISVGYNVHKYERTKQNELDKNEIPVYRATKWEPMEISLVAVPADEGSGIRQEQSAGKRDSAQTIETQILNFNRMPENVNGPAETQETNLGTPPANTGGERNNGVDPAEAQRAGAAQERERQGNIRSAVKKAGLSTDYADELCNQIKDGRSLTVDEARALILDKLAETKDTPVAPDSGRAASASGDPIMNVVAAMSEALMHRAQPGSVERYNKVVHKRDGGMSAEASDYRHSSMLDMARIMLERAGVRGTRGMNPEEVCSTYFRLMRSYQGQRDLVTSDLPDLFTSTANRFRRMDYEPIVPSWMQFSRLVPASDFRTRTGIKVDEAVTFEELAENGEYKESTLMSYDKAVIQLRTYGRKISISRKTIINDDLDVISRAPMAMNLGWQQFMARKVWGLITDNAKAPDNKALFHVDHKNLASAGTVINDGSLSAARVAMRRQKSPQGNELLIRPRFILVPPELETVVEKQLSAIQAFRTDDVNIWKSLVPIVNDYFTSPLEWYMAADPNSTTVDGIVHSFLSGQEGLHTETMIDFDTDKLVLKGRGDFDAAVWGWEGWYKNPGAAAVSPD